MQNDSKTCSVSSDSASDGTGEVPKGVRDKIYAANEIPDSLKTYLYQLMYQMHVVFQEKDGHTLEVNVLTMLYQKQQYYGTIRNPGL